MNCPICEKAIGKGPVVFQQQYFPRLQQDQAICKRCISSFSEQDIYNKLAPPSPPPKEGSVVSMVITTTPSVEGHKVIRYLGIVTGDAIMGANIFKDLFAGVRDIVGGRAGAYEKQLIRAKEIAMSEMKERAEQLGANAIVGVNLDYETLKGTMLMASASGTAVVVE